MQIKNRYAKCPECGAILEINPILDGALCALCGASFAVKPAAEAFLREHPTDELQSTTSASHVDVDDEVELIDKAVQLAKKGIEERHKRSIFRREAKLQKQKMENDRALEEKRLELERMKLAEEAQRRRDEEDRKIMPFVIPILLIGGGLMIALLYFASNMA